MVGNTRSAFALITRVRTSASRPVDRFRRERWPDLPKLEGSGLVTVFALRAIGFAEARLWNGPPPPQIHRRRASIRSELQYRFSRRRRPQVGGSILSGKTRPNCKRRLIPMSAGAGRADCNDLARRTAKRCRDGLQTDCRMRWETFRQAPFTRRGTPRASGRRCVIEGVRSRSPQAWP